MDVVRVDPAGLHALAARCEALAAELTATTPPVVPDNWQPSMAAASAVHASITATARTISARLSDTAGALSDGAAAYETHDAVNAFAIEAVKL